MTSTTPMNAAAKAKIEEIRRQLRINVEIAKRDHPEGPIVDGKRVQGMLHSQEILAGHIDDRLKELEAYLDASKEAVAVKALVWRFFDVGHDYGHGVWDATMPFASMHTILDCRVEDDSGSVRPVDRFYLKTLSRSFDTLEAAQAAAEADYETRIRSALAPATLAVPGDVVEALRINEVIEEESQGGAACGWRSCTGCHETNEGCETGDYPFSKVFRCYIGAGCGECGGIGVVWEYISEAGLKEMERSLEAPAIAGVAALPVRTEDRKTFVVPDGYEAVFDNEGRATGEVRPLHVRVDAVAWRVKVNDNGMRMYVYTELLPYDPLTDTGIKVLSEPEPLFAHPPEAVTDAMVDVALGIWFETNEPWYAGMANGVIEGCERQMRAALEAAGRSALVKP